MENSFLELRSKEVINVTDGKRLGHIVDIVFELPSGRVKGLVVPVCSGGFSLFKPVSQAFIPFEQICKIGDDTILVEVFSDNTNNSGYVLNAPKKKFLFNNFLFGKNYDMVKFFDFYKSSNIIFKVIFFGILLIMGVLWLLGSLTKFDRLIMFVVGAIVGGTLINIFLYDYVVEAIYFVGGLV